MEAQPNLAGVRLVELGVFAWITLVNAPLSVRLGVIASSLAIIFCQMTARLSEKANKASTDFFGSAGKLEKLFEKLHADTVSMMRHTVARWISQVGGPTSGLRAGAPMTLSLRPVL